MGVYLVMPSTSGKHCCVHAAPLFSAGRADPVLLASCGSAAVQEGATCGPSLIHLKAQIPAVQKGNFIRRLIFEAQELLAHPDVKHQISRLGLSRNSFLLGEGAHGIA